MAGTCSFGIKDYTILCNHTRNATHINTCYPNHNSSIQLLLLPTIMVLPQTHTAPNSPLRRNLSSYCSATRLIRDSFLLIVLVVFSYQSYDNYLDSQVELDRFGEVKEKDVPTFSPTEPSEEPTTHAPTLPFPTANPTTSPTDESENGDNDGDDDGK